MISPGDQAEKRLQKRLQRRLRHRVSSDFIGKISLGVPKGRGHLIGNKPA